MSEPLSNEAKKILDHITRSDPELAEIIRKYYAKKLNQNSDNTIFTWQDMAETLGPIEWEWKGWLPKAMSTLIVSESGTGKSGLMLRIAASFILGWDWPDGQKFGGETGTVVWCEAEAAQAINLSRAQKWGLPLKKLYIPTGDTLEDFDLDNNDHLAAIHDKALLPEVKAIIIDSLSGAIGGKEKESDILPRVKWLAELARNTGKPVITSHHLRKRSLQDGESIMLERVRGSSSIVQTARLVWAVDVPDLNNPESKRLQVIKSNLDRFPDPLGFSISESGLDFGAAPSAPVAETQFEKAIELLKRLLSAGPVQQTDIEEQCTKAGISLSTINRAKTKLGVKSTKMNRSWAWSLPGQSLPLPGMKTGDLDMVDDHDDVEYLD